LAKKIKNKSQIIGILELNLIHFLIMEKFEFHFCLKYMNFMKIAVVMSIFL